MKNKKCIFSCVQSTSLYQFWRNQMFSSKGFMDLCFPSQKANIFKRKMFALPRNTFVCKCVFSSLVMIVLPSILSEQQYYGSNTWPLRPLPGPLLFLSGAALQSQGLLDRATSPPLGLSALTNEPRDTVAVTSKVLVHFLTGEPFKFSDVQK